MLENHRLLAAVLKEDCVSNANLWPLCVEMSSFSTQKNRQANFCWKFYHPILGTSSNLPDGIFWGRRGTKLNLPLQWTKMAYTTWHIGILHLILIFVIFVLVCCHTIIWYLIKTAIMPTKLLPNWYMNNPLKRIQNMHSDIVNSDILFGNQSFFAWHEWMTGKYNFESFIQNLAIGNRDVNYCVVKTQVEW